MSQPARLRADELIGREVVHTSGKRLGHVHDLRAERIENDLCITGLMIGPRSWLVKLGIARGHAWEIAWENVVEIGDTIRVRGAVMERD